MAIMLTMEKRDSRKEGARKGKVENSNSKQAAAYKILSKRRR